MAISSLIGYGCPYDNCELEIIHEISQFAITPYVLDNPFDPNIWRVDVRFCCGAGHIVGMTKTVTKEEWIKIRGKNW